MQESVSLRIFARRKGMICVRPTDICMKNLWQKAKRGKKTGTNSNTRFPQASCFKKMHDVCQKYGVVLWITKVMRKRDKKSDSRAAEKGAKKLVSSNCAKILE
jgi:hypothetical protein